MGEVLGRLVVSLSQLVHVVLRRHDRVLLLLLSRAHLREELRPDFTDVARRYGCSVDG